MDSWRAVARLVASHKGVDESLVEVIVRAFGHCMPNAFDWQPASAFISDPYTKRGTYLVLRHFPPDQYTFQSAISLTPKMPHIPFAAMSHHVGSRMNIHSFPSAITFGLAVTFRSLQSRSLWHLSAGFCGKPHLKHLDAFCLG